MTRGDEPPGVTCGSLRVTLSRIADRWGHSVWRRDGQHWIEVLRSAESQADAPPLSTPVLQQVHQQANADGNQMLFLVGLSDKNHWSLAVEADPAERRIVLDIACRFKQTPAALGSRYEILDRTSQAFFHQSVSALPISGADEPTVQAHAGMISIQAALGSGPQPRTVRWRYAFVELPSPAAMPLGQQGA